MTTLATLPDDSWSTLRDRLAAATLPEEDRHDAICLDHARHVIDPILAEFGVIPASCAPAPRTASEIVLEGMKKRQDDQAALEQFSRHAERLVGIPSPERLREMGAKLEDGAWVIHLGKNKPEA